MKRWIHANQNIYGMSMERKKAQSRIENISDLLLEHVCKCLLYKNTTGDYRHWIYDEIGSWLSYVNDITVKPKGNKLKAADYAKGLFGGFGDDFADARLNLNIIYRNLRKEVPPYPEVAITNELIQNLVDVSNTMKETFSTVLASPNSLTATDLGDLAKHVLDKYCLGGQET